MSYSIADFVSDVDRVLEEKGETMETVWALGPRLQRLVEEGGDLTEQGEPSSGTSGLAGRVLHVDPDGRFRLVVARFASDQPTPVHSHHRWGLECGVSGRERFTVWTRMDEGGDRATRGWRSSLTTTSSGATSGTGTTHPGTSTASGPREGSRRAS